MRLWPLVVVPVTGDEVVTILSRIREPTFPEDRRSVVTSGDVSSLNGAIAEMSRAGGGTLEVAGDYTLEGSLVLQSNIRLRLRQARLRWTARRSNYLPPVLTKFEGIEVLNYQPLLRSSYGHNLSVVGLGTLSILDGGGKGWRPKSRKNGNAVRKMMTRPVAERNIVKFDLPPSFVQFFRCTTVHFENLTLTNTPWWTVHPVYSTNVIIRGLILRTFSTKNSDGIDPDSSVDVLIEKNDLLTGDDAVAIKSGRDLDGRRVGRSSKNIILRDNVIRTSPYNAFCIGSEVSGGVENIFFLDNIIHGGRTAFFFKSNTDRGAFIRNVVIENVTALNITDSCVQFIPTYKQHQGGQQQKYPTKFSDFALTNVHCHLSRGGGGGSHHREPPHGGSALAAVGLDDGHPIANLRISNFVLFPSSTGSSSQPPLVALKFARNVTFTNVSLDAGKSVVSGTFFDVLSS